MDVLNRLISWLRCIADIRIVCAHHGRLWNREISVKPELLPRWRGEAVNREKLYVVLVVVEHLIRKIAPESSWKGRLTEHLLSHIEVPLTAMRCPDDWYRRYHGTSHDHDEGLRCVSLYPCAAEAEAPGCADSP